MKPKRTTTFTHGSGCYTCRACGRKTRDDGHGDNVHTRLCTQCFDMGGIENEIADYGDDEATFLSNTGRTLQRARTELARLKAAVVAKGGSLPTE